MKEKNGFQVVGKSIRSASLGELRSVVRGRGGKITVNFTQYTSASGRIIEGEWFSYTAKSHSEAIEILNIALGK